MSVSTKHPGRGRSPARERSLKGAGVFLLMGSLAACGSLDGLLDVELPGNITDQSLNDPLLAESIALGAQAEFECAFQGHRTQIDGLWAQEYHGNFSRPRDLTLEQRSARFKEYGDLECTHSQMRVYLPMHVARVTGQEAARRITEEIPAAEDREYLVGLSKAYEGYATQLLSEAFCGIVFNGDGVVRSRAEGFAAAEGLFTEAIQLASQALNGDRAVDAQSIINMSLVGRARARLNQGNGAGAVADARLVPEDFVRFATYNLGSGSRRSNFNSQVRDQYTLHWRYRNLTIAPDGRATQDEGVADPRVPSENRGLLRGIDWWVSPKYATDGTHIPFATGREALLMIAEVEGGQTAVNIINHLRDTVGDAPYVEAGNYNLPHFSSTDEAEIRAAVLEERRRELFQQGTKIGDDMRHGRAALYDTGLTPSGRPYAGDSDCVFIPDVEFN